MISMATIAADIGRVPMFIHGSGFQLLDGALLERTGVEAVKQWFELVLRQQIDKIPIYPSTLGIDRSLLQRGLPEGYVYAEIERQVRETAALCDAVRQLSAFSFTRSRHGLEVAFTATLYDGTTVEEVITVV